MKSMVNRDGKLLVRDTGMLIYEELLRRGHAVNKYEMKHKNSITLTVSIGYDSTQHGCPVRRVTITHTWPENEHYDIQALDDFMNGKKSSLGAEIDMHEALE